MTTAIFGLDGATYRVINSNRDELPTLNRLIQEGYASQLQSTEPPTTSVAWPAFATGQNPGSYGIYDFMSQDPEKKEFFINDARKRLEGFFWEYMSEDVGLASIPMIPYHAVDGFFIQGSLARINEDQIMDPPDLTEQLPSDYDYRIDWRNDNEKIVAGVKRRVRARGEFFLELLQKHDLGLYFFMFNAIDHIQHHFWAYMDESHPAHQESIFDSVVLDIYQEVDDVLAELLAELDEDTNVILASDHGFKPNKVEVNINALLAEQGYVDFDVDFSGSVLTQLHDFAKKYISYDTMTTLLPKVAQEAARSRMPINDRIGTAINWENTSAYSFGVMPNVYINLNQNGKAGIVSRDQYEPLLEELESMFLSLKDPNNQPVFKEVKRGANIYEGPFSFLAPDLVLRPYEDFYCSGNIGDTVFRPKNEPMPNSGVHEREGIFIASGPNVTSNSGTTDKQHDITDVAPTVLRLNGYEVPESFDGTAITDAINFEGPYAPAVRDEETIIKDRVLALKQLSHI